MTASFPILMGNAIYWCSESRREREATGFGGGRTGEFVEFTGKEVRWTAIRGGELVKEVEKLDRNVVELRRSGVWEDAEGQRGAAHLLSREESDLPVLGTAVEAEGQSRAFVSLGALTGTLLAALLFLLVLESLLFHRFGVY